MSEKRRSTFDLVSLIVGPREIKRDVVRWVRRAETRSRDMADDCCGAEDVCTDGDDIPLGFVGGVSEVACLAVAFKCFLDVRWAS